MDRRDFLTALGLAPWIAGPAGAVGDAARALDPVATQVETAVSGVERERLWTLRHAASPILAGLSNDRRSMQVIEDGCVPLPRLGEYIRFLRETAEAQDLTVVIFGHAGRRRRSSTASAASWPRPPACQVST